jgi:hypothetical protein
MAPPQFLESKYIYIYKVKNQNLLNQCIFLAHYPSQQYKRNENSKQRLIPEKMRNKKLLNPRNKRGGGEEGKKNPKYFGNLLKNSYGSRGFTLALLFAITRNAILLRPKWSSGLAR